MLWSESLVERDQLKYPGVEENIRTVPIDVIGMVRDLVVRIISAEHRDM